MTSIPVVYVLDAKIHSIEKDSAVNVVEELIRKRSTSQVCVLNVWSTVLMQKDRRFMKVNNEAALVIPDGMPLVWVSRLFGNPLKERVAGWDLFSGIASRSSEKGYRHYFLGSSSDILDAIKERLEKTYSGLEIAGTYAPPFRKEFTHEENEEMVTKINSAAPDILWVGMTAPKQEKWIFQHLPRLNVPVCIGVGAVFDFLAGRQRRAPQWMQKAGLEWLFRFLREPGRLWKRYLVGNAVFIWLILKRIFSRSP